MSVDLANVIAENIAARIDENWTVPRVSRRLQYAARLSDVRNSTIPSLWRPGLLSWQTDSPLRLSLKKAAIRAIHEYSERNERGRLTRRRGSLMLSGDTGTGKSHLACAILRGCILRRLDCCFINWSEYVLTYRQTWNGRSEVLDDVLELEALYRDADLAVLDEVGGVGDGKHSDHESTLLYNLLRTRLERGVPTIYTTNLTPDELNRLGGAAGKVARRVMESTQICYVREKKC